jgi:hypothetical protein
MHQPSQQSQGHKPQQTPAAEHNTAKPKPQKTPPPMK